VALNRARRTDKNLAVEAVNREHLSSDRADCKILSGFLLFLIYFVNEVQVLPNEFLLCLFDFLFAANMSSLTLSIERSVLSAGSSRWDIMLRSWCHL